MLTKYYRGLSAGGNDNFRLHLEGLKTCRADGRAVSHVQDWISWRGARPAFTVVSDQCTHELQQCRRFVTGSLSFRIKTTTIYGVAGIEPQYVASGG